MSPLDQTSAWYNIIHAVIHHSAVGFRGKSGQARVTPRRRSGFSIHAVHAMRRSSGHSRLDITL